MKALLDTAVFIWLCKDPAKLSARVLICGNTENDLYLSVASIWEIQIKILLGKLEFDVDLAQTIQRQVADCGLKIIGIDPAHIYALKNLPSIHKDPFDRMIIAQAREIDAALLTCDVQIAKYPIKVIW